MRGSGGGVMKREGEGLYEGGKVEVQENYTHYGLRVDGRRWTTFLIRMSANERGGGGGDVCRFYEWGYALRVCVEG